MLYLVGDPETREYQAATTLRGEIVRAWPNIDASQRSHIWLIAGARCFGQTFQDIDILIIGECNEGERFQPSLSVAGSFNANVDTNSISVKSLCIAIEVKDHFSSAVEFRGSDVYVKYGDVRKSATSQSMQQPYSVQNYLRALGLDAPFVANVLWMRNVPVGELPTGPHNIAGTPLTWNRLLSILTSERPAQTDRDRLVVDHWANSATGARSGAEHFARVLVPTELDRRRMERIGIENADVNTLLTEVGNRMLILRGSGGTGKTMRLLQLANRLVRERGERVLILTFNRALASDLSRLLALYGMKDDERRGYIGVQTIYSFVYRTLSRLHLEPVPGLFFTEYDARKNELVELLRSGTIQPSDLARIREDHPREFDWNCVMVDEGQDWPDDEQHIIEMLFDAEHLVISEGRNQLIRSVTPARWGSSLSNRLVKTVPLHRQLRMKANLARFATALSNALGIVGERYEADDSIPGGRIIVLDGPYLSHSATHAEIFRGNELQGNEPVDVLFCTPPSGPMGQEPGWVADMLRELGHETWDGTAEDERQVFPLDTQQVRVVQYQSCRGLEGWIVVGLGADRFHNLKIQEAQRGVQGMNAGADREAWRRFAGNWLMLLATRAMDTLVIQLDLEGSALRTALIRAAEECGDSVVWQIPKSS